MSATVLGCGHTSHMRLFNIDVVMTAPQVHLHFMTNDDEYDELGYAKVELCCHGCGASTLVYYTNTDKPDRRVQVRDEFVKVHARCPNRSYQSSCPDWRTSFKLLDIRQKTVKWEDQALPMGRKRRFDKKTALPLPPPPQPKSRPRKTQRP